uniref:Uncharacterized protein n=1 Tax=Caenorhabditis japonica TaxID=281687 RepID=A0A8R1EWX5_CAEJA
MGRTHNAKKRWQMDEASARSHRREATRWKTTDEMVRLPKRRNIIIPWRRSQNTPVDNRQGPKGEPSLGEVVDALLPERGGLRVEEVEQFRLDHC